MTWVEVRADSLSPGDVILRGRRRTVESVAGNADRIVVTLEGDGRIDGPPPSYGKASLVWKEVD